MRLQVTVAVTTPVDQPPLDALQRQGAAAVINYIIGRAVDAVGPNGERLTVADSLVAAHPGGAEIGVVIDTPDRSAPVTEMVTDLVRQILHTTPALAGWAISDVSTEELPAPPVSTARPAPRGSRPRTRPGRR